MGSVAPQSVPPNWIIDHPGISALRTREEPLLSRRVSEISDATHGLPGRKRCVVFTTGGSVDYVYLAPYMTGHADEFDVSLIFPDAASSARMTNIPGTVLRLERDYRVVVSRFIGNSLLNVSIGQYYSLEWVGNVVVTKYDANGVPDDVGLGELHFIMTIIGLWLHNIRSMERGLTARAISG